MESHQSEELMNQLGAYRSLSPDDQYDFLLSLLTSTNGFIKWKIKTFLNAQETPDLLTLLPTEIQLHILSMVDGYSLLKACQVSKQWNKFISNCQSLWKEKSKEIGVNLSRKPPHISWQKAFCSSWEQLRLLEKGEAFSEKYVSLQNSRKAVKAVDYNNGYLCTVSEDDCINIWQLGLNIPVISFFACHAVSCVTFKSHSTLVCGHFTGILTSWDISDMSDHCFTHYSSNPFLVVDDQDFAEVILLKVMFKMHCGPVFSCDFSEKLGLLVSGGADEKIMFWCLRMGTILQTINSRDHWVLRVHLMPFDSSSDSHSVFTMTRGSADKYCWPRKSSGDPDCSVQEELWGDLSKVDLTATIRLNDSKDTFITPGLQISSKYVGLVKQDLQEKQATLEILNLASFAPVFSHHLNFKVRKLMALGNRFALILTVGRILNTSTLAVVDICNGNTIGTHTIPHLKMTTPDGAQVVVGDTSWLDGLVGWELPLSLVDRLRSTQEYSEMYSDEEFDEQFSGDATQCEASGKCEEECVCEQGEALSESRETCSSSGCCSTLPKDCEGAHNCLTRDNSSDSSSKCDNSFKLCPSDLVCNSSADSVGGSSSDSFSQESGSANTKAETRSGNCEGRCESLPISREERKFSSATGASCRQLTHGERKSYLSLVLAAGIRSEAGRVFTLWWENGKQEKRKMD